MDTFFEIGVILAFATVIAFIMQMLRLPLLLGHIITGLLVGPAAFNLLRSEETLHIFSQLGITALLFIVGLSLSPRVVRDVGRISLITGLGQVIFTSLIGYGIIRLFGYPPFAAAMLATALTFSSTIIISKLLSDRGDLDTLYGKISIGFLLVQDLVATAILIVATATFQQTGTTDALAELGLKLLIVGAFLTIVGVWVLPRLTKLFASSQEFLFIFSIGWGVGLAALFRYFGLSTEIGALAAGVTLASSPYHYEISAKMKLVRDFFIVMFFILLGSQLAIGDVAAQIIPAIVLSLFILIGNPFIVMVLMGIMRYSKKTSFYAGLTVAQISEFSLILILLGVEHGALAPELLSLITVVGIITITGSTFFIIHADRLYALLAPVLGIFERKSARPERRKRERYDAILFGCHRVGADFLPTFEKLELSSLVVDFDPVLIDQLRDKGVSCRYGDASDNEFLDELDLSALRLVAATVPDFETNLFILEKVRKANAKALVVVRAHTVDEAQLLYKNGADYVLMPHYLGGNMAAMLLEKLGHDTKKFDIHRKRHLQHLARRMG